MGLYRPTVTRKRKNGTRYREKARLWWGRFRHPVSGKRVSVPLKTTDKTAARTLLNEAERRAAREAAGLTNPYEQHADRPLLEQVDDFEQHLLNKGDTAKHAKRTSGCVRSVIAGCRWRRWADISPSEFLRFVAERRSSGISIRTHNVILGAVKAFCRWMVADRRAPQNPLAYLQSQNDRTDPRRERRAFAAEELRILLKHTADGPDRSGLSGAERATLYQLAVETGLRVSELHSLTWACVNLESTPPTVIVKAAYSKRRRDDIQPMSVPAGQMLATWRNAIGNPAPADPVFPNLTRWTRTAELLRADLEAARAEWIEDASSPEERNERDSSDVLRYFDSAGRYADFHALRHTFITNLVRGGVHPKVAQTLARHSTITLTMDRYSHTVLGEQIEALNVLPDLATDRPQTDPLKSTGTDDR